MSDPRGPRRTIVAVRFVHNDETPSWLFGDAEEVTLDCGHIQYGTPHYSRRVGDSFHCLKCRREATQHP